MATLGALSRWVFAILVRESIPEDLTPASLKTAKVAKGSHYGHDCNFDELCLENALRLCSVTIPYRLLGHESHDRFRCGYSLPWRPCRWP